MCAPGLTAPTAHPMVSDHPSGPGRVPLLQGRLRRLERLHPPQPLLQPVLPQGGAGRGSEPGSGTPAEILISGVVGPTQACSPPPPGAQGSREAPGPGQLLGGRCEPDPGRGAAAAEHGPVPALAEQGREGSLRQGPRPLRAAWPALPAAQSPAAALRGLQHQVSARGLRGGDPAEQPQSVRLRALRGGRGTCCTPAL